VEAFALELLALAVHSLLIYSGIGCCKIDVLHIYFNVGNVAAPFMPRLSQMKSRPACSFRAVTGGFFSCAYDITFSIALFYSV